ncbi:anion permease [Salmonella enterica]|uniref:Sodium:sulfate symporter n=4 Tax=Salmonella enterica TaxID=28901 RepID=A0A3R0XUV1_SALET|nr:sodium:sulfate symporter [Salmonella enterica subsp. enterica serovar Java]EAO1480672.1 sodium:sulfate symporter [Salmonella enterica]EBR9315253.1 sodium:sulfate symporter [Salmonella enterica subsp. enterica serovar Muenchen]EBW6041199.1 sodium:sulfate symporter [Salmonella enterica subsp. enterica serovar Oranienburg]EDQ3995733.1 sodium:sulfate symporter [Salmonella enterica subsp. enterica]EDX3512662.1 sodium:sulfate symporter [Salmonella enterica subsp. enterica serovar Adelaide]EEE503
MIKKSITLFVFFFMCFPLFLPTLSPELKIGTVIFSTVLLWATGLVPEWFSSFSFLTVCSIFSLAPADTIFSGFTSSAAWLVISGVVISAAITHIGLGEVLASYVYPYYIGSCKKAIFTSAFLGLITAFIMPSAMNRIILLVPILDSIARKLGYNVNERGYKGIIISGVLGSYLPATAILPANVPNNIFIGLIEKIFTKVPTYNDYLVLHFPVLGLTKFFITTLVIAIIYNDKPTNKSIFKIRFNGRQKTLSLILLFSVILWITEPLHKISTSTISLLTALLCLIPGTDFLPEKPLTKLNTNAFFYVATIVSLGTIAYQSGVAQYIATHIAQLLPYNKTSFLDNFISLSSLSGLMGLVVTIPGVPGILTPMTKFFSELTGMSVEMVYMTQVVGFSTVFFVYQAPPLVIACQTGKISSWEVSKICFISAILSILILWPLDAAWWKTVGGYIFR